MNVNMQVMERRQKYPCGKDAESNFLSYITQFIWEFRPLNFD